MEFIKRKRTRDETNRQADVRVRINVGGTVFETWKATLVRM